MTWCRTLVGLSLAVVVAAAPLSATDRAPVRGTGGAVASAAPAATAAGIEVLEAGGNAADAAVAVALALAVVHPQAGNLGGGGFAVVRLDGDVTTLDFRETAPLAATHDMYLGPDGEPVRERSLVGPLAAGVPGSPAGLAELHRRYGQLPWPRVVAPAVRLARDGFVVTDRLSREVAAAADLLGRFPETSRVWLPGGTAPAPGSVMRLPALAAVLAGYAERGPEAITGGRVAAAVEAASRRHGGVLTASDLADYRPVWRSPVRFELAGWSVASMPLPSSGGIILAQTAGLLERLGWTRVARDGADRAHLLAEAWRRAYADRYLLGDPATTLAGPRELLDSGWLDGRAASIDPARATPSDRVACWAPPTERPDTTHLSVVDADGGAVSLTTTLNGSFGCGVLVPEAGFLLNNEMDDFAAAPGRTNLYGLVQGEANSVGPGKRMLSSMSPTVAWRGDEVIALGSPGGSRIPTATSQVLLSLLVDGDGLREAVARPRIHHQWWPDRIDAEPGALSSEVRAELGRRGHSIVARAEMGEVHAVRRRPDGVVEAAADPRGPGAAAATPALADEVPAAVEEAR